MLSLNNSRVFAVWLLIEASFHQGVMGLNSNATNRAAITHGSWVSDSSKTGIHSLQQLMNVSSCLPTAYLSSNSANFRTIEGVPVSYRAQKNRVWAQFYRLAALDRSHLLQRNISSFTRTFQRNLWRNNFHMSWGGLLAVAQLWLSYCIVRRLTGQHHGYMYIHTQ